MNEHNVIDQSVTSWYQPSFLDTVVTGQIQRNNTVREKGTLDPSFDTRGRKWFRDNKSHSFFLLKWKRDFEKNRRIVSPSDPEKIEKEYLKERKAREIKQKENKWVATLAMARLLHQFKEKKISNMKCHSSLYDEIFRMEPRRYISRPKFNTCVHNATKIQSRNVARRNNPHETILNRRLETLYSTFDVRNQNEMDWRLFLYMLDICANPILDCKAHLLRGFRFFSDRGSVDVTSRQDRIRLRDSHRILDPFVRAEKTVEIERLFEDARIGAATTDGAIKSDGRRGETSMSFRVYESTLDRIEEGGLFENARQWGNGKTGIWLCAFEIRYYPFPILEHVKRERREVKLMQIVLERIVSTDKRRKRHTLKRWKSFVWRREWFKQLLNKMAIRYRNKMSTIFFDIRQHAVEHFSVVEIQRVSRGFVGRMEATFRQILFRSAVSLQSHFRMLFARRRYLSACLYRKWAGTEIQRHVRGNISRRITLNKILTRVDKELIRLEEERNEWERDRMVSASVTIQRSCRLIEARKRAREKRTREKKVKKEMEQNKESYKIERRIFEKQVEEFYCKKRAEWESENVLMARNEAERVKIRTYRRLITKDNTDEREKKQQEEDKVSEHNQHEEWLGHWKKIVEDRCESYKKYCMHCMDSPDTLEEKKLRAEIKNKIKARLVDVLERANSRNIIMETPEGYEIAGKEIIFILGEEERERVRQEMKVEALTNTEKNLREANDVLLIKTKQGLLDINHAALLMSLACRRWIARKKLRIKCSEAHEKCFDETYSAFYYRNRLTGQTMWEKPKAFGRFDIPAIDEWKLLRDAHNFPYYYNPFYMDMSWTPPSGVTMCDERISYVWWEEFPRPTGQCINFATRMDVSDEKKYCHDCWIKKYHLKSVSPKDYHRSQPEFKIINGAKVEKGLY